MVYYSKTTDSGDGNTMIDYGLKDKIVLVTGANNPQGIGAATALAFAREGAKIILVYKKVSDVCQHICSVSCTLPIIPCLFQEGYF